MFKMGRLLCKTSHTASGQRILWSQERLGRICGVNMGMPGRFRLRSHFLTCIVAHTSRFRCCSGSRGCFFPYCKASPIRSRSSMLSTIRFLRDGQLPGDVAVFKHAWFPIAQGRRILRCASGWMHEASSSHGHPHINCRLLPRAATTGYASALMIMTTTRS